MKNSGNNIDKQNRQGMSKKQRPEVRDDLDSLINEEQESKGDDMTTNKKETKSDKLKKKD